MRSVNTNPIASLLIANRSEIAIRAMQAAAQMDMLGSIVSVCVKLGQRISAG